MYQPMPTATTHARSSKQPHPIHSIRLPPPFFSTGAAAASGGGGTGAAWGAAAAVRGAGGTLAAAAPTGAAPAPASAPPPGPARSGAAEVPCWAAQVNPRDGRTPRDHANSSLGRILPVSEGAP